LLAAIMVQTINIKMKEASIMIILTDKQDRGAIIRKTMINKQICQKELLHPSSGKLLLGSAGPTTS